MEFDMTFFEAAVEVLRTARRPLDYKTITQLAINRKLLGHIGHTPDIVMASCLMRSVRRLQNSPIIRTQDGRFALKEWPVEWLNDAPVAMIENGATVLPKAKLGLLEATKAIKILKTDNVKFRQAVKLKFEAEIFADDVNTEEEMFEIADGENKKYDQLRFELNAQHNEHINLCAAIVKVLRHENAPMRSQDIAQCLSQKNGVKRFEQAIVLAMRADNALRASHGKRAFFVHIAPDLWTLSEKFLARHVLKLETKLYDISRQLRLYTTHALSMKLRELSPFAWLQLASIIIKQLNYTIDSQYMPAEGHFIFRAEEVRGLSYVPVLIKVIHAKLVGTEDVIAFRELIKELGYDHGVLLVNSELSRDALKECATKELPIYVYSAKQIAPIMYDAKIGVTPNQLPVVFVDNYFFQSLLAKDGGEDTGDSVREVKSGFGIDDIETSHKLDAAKFLLDAATALKDDED